MRALLAILIVLFVVTQYAYWWGHGGRAELRDLQVTMEQQRAEISSLAERNATLAAEVADLKQGIEAIEELARSEMGMIKDDEVFYQIIENRPEERASLSGRDGL